jgi:hypothetical protein
MLLLLLRVDPTEGAAEQDLRGDVGHDHACPPPGGGVSITRPYIFQPRGFNPLSEIRLERRFQKCVERVETPMVDFIERITKEIHRAVPK